MSNRILTIILSVLAFLVAILVMNYKDHCLGVIQFKPSVVENPQKYISPIESPPIKTSPKLPIILPVPKSYVEAVEIAKKNDKKLFLIFYATWCSPCQQMKTNVWTNNKVKFALRNYVVYMVNVDKDREIANECGVRTVPTYGIFDTSSGATKLMKVTSGGRNVEEFLGWLEQ